jgi:hypothetical protein
MIGVEHKTRWVSGMAAKAGNDERASKRGRQARQGSARLSRRRRARRSGDMFCRYKQARLHNLGRWCSSRGWLDRRVAKGIGAQCKERCVTAIAGRNNNGAISCTQWIGVLRGEQCVETAVVVVERRRWLPSGMN